MQWTIVNRSFNTDIKNLCQNVYKKILPNIKVKVGLLDASNNTPIFRHTRDVCIMTCHCPSARLVLPFLLAPSGEYHFLVVPILSFVNHFDNWTVLGGKWNKCLAIFAINVSFSSDFLNIKTSAYGFNPVVCRPRTQPRRVDDCKQTWLQGRLLLSIGFVCCRLKMVFDQQHGENRHPR